MALTAAACNWPSVVSFAGLSPPPLSALPSVCVRTSIMCGSKQTSVGIQRGKCSYRYFEFTHPLSADAAMLFDNSVFVWPRATHSPPSSL